MPNTSSVDHAASSEVAQLRRLELISLFEAATLIVLLAVAVPLKHFGGWPVGVQIMGPLHGLAFCTYIWIVIQTVSGADWRPGEVVRMIVFAILPVGGFFNAAFISRKIRSLNAEKRP